MTIASLLCVWVALGSFAQAIADGLGEQPARGLTVGSAVVLVSVAALVGRRRVATILRRRSWPVVVFAVGQLALASAEGLVGGPYTAWTLISVGVAVIAGSERVVWLCVATLCVGYAGVVLLVESSLRELVRDGDLGDLVGALLAYPLTALVLLTLRRRYIRFVTGAPVMIEQIRQEGGVQLPALPGRFDLGLTRAERRVVDALAKGWAPKQMAHRWGVADATIRTHIRHAKRKTGARTIPELVALTANLPSLPGGEPTP